MTPSRIRDAVRKSAASPPVMAVVATLVLLGAAQAATGSRASKAKRAGTVAAVASAPSGASNPAVSSASADSGKAGYTLHGGQEGTAFKSLTVEGEDRIHVEFDRPPLLLDLDPAKAPGLELGTARDVLDRSEPDLTSPLTALSARQPSPHVAHPWLDRFATGAVARFRPDVKGVERWKLVVANARGEMVASFDGRGDPPDEITWDGRSKSGALVSPGLTYSYVFEAVDRAGNKRNFVGQGFQVSAYRLQSADGPTLVFSGRELGAPPDPRRAAPTGAPSPPIVIEAATWLNQSPKSTQQIRVTATARSFEQADHLARRVAAALVPHLIGDPARVQPVAEVQPDAPESGTLKIASAR